MSDTETPAETLLTRPKRADARRNYEKVLAADVGERDVHDRDVEEQHERADRDRHQGPPLPFHATDLIVNL